MVYENKKHFHRKYKYAVRVAKRNENTFKQNKLAEKLSLGKIFGEIFAK